MPTKLLALGLALCAVHAAAVENRPMMHTPGEIKSLLQQNPPECFPEIASVDRDSLGERPLARKFIAHAREGRPIPPLPWTLYQDFGRTGERRAFEQPYHERRRLLQWHTLAAWLEPEDPELLDRACDIIWAICEETSWILPAHRMPKEWHIDLGSSTTGASLATAAHLLGDRLPEPVRARIEAEVRRRILDPYLDHAEDYWWHAGGNNWTGVCAASAGLAYLMLEDNQDRQAKGIAQVLIHLSRFVERGFAEDGGCLEGIGYWNYGLIYPVIFGEALRARTGGAVDLLANAKIARIARYPMAVYLGNDTYASFADSRPNYTVHPVLAVKFRERTDYEGLMALVGSSSGGQLPGALGDLLWWDGTDAGEPELEDVFMPVSGLVKKVGMLGGARLVVMAKAGHNAEPHNQNDVGSFIVHIGDSDYLCDPGAGKYDGKYFTEERYENIFANSFGHSVPRIGGTLQRPGAPFRGTLLERQGQAFAIDFAKAYDVPGLERLVREVRMGNDVLTVEDHFAFSDGPVEFESALVTWCDVETTGNQATIAGPEGRLEICAGELLFSVEHLEQACAANGKEGVLTRLSVLHPPAHEGAVRFAMRLFANP